MKTDIVSFRIARKLSEIKSFNDDCYFGYVSEFSNDTNDFTSCLYLKEHPTGICKSITINDKYKEYLAPTYQGLRKWLVKNFNITYVVKRTAKDTYEAYTLRGDHTSEGNIYEIAEENIVYNILNLLINEHF